MTTLRWCQITVISLCSLAAACDQPAAMNDDDADKPVPAFTGILASGQEQPRELAIDNTYVYWVNYGSGANLIGTLMRIPKGGGKPQQLIASPNILSGPIVDKTHVYWVENDRRSGGGQIMRLAKSGEPPEALATGLELPGGLGADADYLYWNSSNGTLHRLGKKGGSAALLASAELNDQVSGIAADGTNVYFATLKGSVVHAISRLGGSVSVLTSAGIYGAEGLTLEGDDLYWHASGDRKLRHANKHGGASEVLITGWASLRLIAVDASRVYVTTYGGNGSAEPGAVVSVSRAGGSVTTMASDNAGGHWGIAVDGSNVYYTNSTLGTVNSLAK